MMHFKLKFRAIPNHGNPVGNSVESVNGKTGVVVLNAADIGADSFGSAQAVQESVDALSSDVDQLSNRVDQKADTEDVDQALSLKASNEYVDQQDQLQRDQIAQVQNLAQTNELKIGTKADQLDLETAQIQIEENRLSILTKADIAALAQLALLVDTKADQAYVNQQIALLVGSAPEALNTIYELAAAIQNESDLITALNESVANRVRFDIATQALTEIQKQNARTNIDAEKIGTAQQLVSQITAQSLGAATAAQGAKADTALQSSDVAPVAFTGSFTSLSNQNKIFDVVFTALQAGVNTGILATDTLGQMLAKLQAQVSTKTSLILGETAVDAYRGDRGKTAYDHSQSTGNVHNLTTGQITSEITNLWFTEPRVRATVLAGLVLQNAAVVDTDNIVTAHGKFQGQLNTKTSLTLGNTSTTALAGNSTTSVVAEGTNLYFTEARVRATLLTGLNTATGGSISPTDTQLSAFGKIQNFMSNQSGMTWVNVTSISGFAYESAVDTANTKIELCKFGGMLWIRGYIRFRAAVLASTEIFQMYNSTYLPDYTYVPSTLMTDISLYGASKILIDVNAVSFLNKWNMSTTSSSSININTSYHIRPQPLFKHA